MRYTLYGHGEGVRAHCTSPVWVSYRDQRVTDASLSARRLGVCPPLTLKTALSLAPGIAVIEESESQVRPMRAVWKFLYRFSPWLQTVDWDGFYLQLSGTDAPLVELRRILTKLDGHLSTEQRFRTGFAETPFLSRLLVEWSRLGVRIPGAAYRQFGRQQVIVSPRLTGACEDWWLAMPISPFWLIPAPVREQLLTLGIYTLGELRACSLTQLRRRFGKQSSLWLRSLDVRDREPLTTNYPPSRLSASFQTCAGDALPPTQIPALLERLANELCRDLAQDGQGALRVSLRWTREDGTSELFFRQTKHPVARSDFLIVQLSPACQQIAAPITDLVLTVEDLRPLPTQQLAFAIIDDMLTEVDMRKHDEIPRVLHQINHKIPGAIRVGAVPSYRELRHHMATHFRA